ncbi:MAG: glycosyltransferase family 2 protein [Cypionkella sp.]
MSVTPLRSTSYFAAGTVVAAPDPIPRLTIRSLATQLMTEGLVAPHQILNALSLHKSRRRHLSEILLAQGVIGPDALYAAVGRHWSVGVADLDADPADPRLTRHINHVTALREGLLPWRKHGNVVVIVTAYPDQFHRHTAWLREVFGPVAMAVAPLRQIELALLTIHGPQLAHSAENRVSASESCRSYTSTTMRHRAIVISVYATVLAMFSPLGFAAVLFGLALLAMFSANFLKLAALITAPPINNDPDPELDSSDLPVVSIMVALYREDSIAPRLAARLDKLDYSRELLDILLVVEADDHLTRDALAKTDLPGWMRVIVVPNGSVKTKPRALNYALDHCRGSIIGIYDAEDAPEPDQITKVVTRFQNRGPEVACLQGKLDYYNPRTNWLARCFTIEYAAWFRVFLPGIESLGLAIPLGGTTLFFRRRALEELGGWDAQNVTEDADLGIRIYRHGYRTELVETTTFEEANCRSVAWIKQRSRWIKGYMMTYMTHMRDPAQLWHDLGPRRFIGLQVQFMATTLQTLLAPLLWTFWLLPFGVHHPIVAAMSYPVFIVIAALMMLIALMIIVFDIIGMRRTCHRLNPLWAVTLILYQPLSTLAAYKALWELLTKPFYWDKTSHGHFDA